MGIKVYSLLRVIQDVYNQPYFHNTDREFPKFRGTLFWDPYNKDPTI